jgi:hypothetical protein
MPDTNFEQLMTDINARLASLDGLKEQVSDARLAEIVKTQLDLLLAEDGEFIRKMRFGAGGGDRKLVGSKYARWGLSVADVEWLYDAMEAAKAKGLGSGPSEELRNTFAAISEAVYMPMEQVREMDKTAIDGLFPRIPLGLFHGKDREHARKGDFELTDAYQRAIRAMDTAESGFGSQLVGAQYVGDLWEAARAESRLFGLIPSFEMLNATAYLPVEVDIPEMLFVGESTSANATAYATSKTGSQRVQVDAKKFVIHQQWSGELEEESIIPFVPFLRRQGQLSINHYSDSVVLNGDTTNAGTGNINLDDADPADTKHYLAFDGIRHAGLVDNTANGANLAGAISYAALVAQKGRMVDAARFVDWGHPTNPEDLVYVADVETGDRIGNLDEVINQKEVRSRALLSGEFADILGHPAVTSLAMSKTEADGKASTTGGNNVKGQVVAFNRRGFVVGWRRRVKLEFDRDIKADQNILVYSLRLGFGRFSPTGAASGIEAADVIYNITL